MKKHLEYLYLLAPAVVWWLSSQVLGDQFSMPNRLMLAVLCTAAGAGAMLTQRKLPGALALVAGLAMLASVPVTHELPQSAFSPRLSNSDLPQIPSTPRSNDGQLHDNQPADHVCITTVAILASRIEGTATAHCNLFIAPADPAPMLRHTQELTSRDFQSSDSGLYFIQGNISSVAEIQMSPDRSNDSAEAIPDDIKGDRLLQASLVGHLVGGGLLALNHLGILKVQPPWWEVMIFVGGTLLMLYLIWGLGKMEAAPILSFCIAQEIFARQLHSLLIPTILLLLFFSMIAFIAAGLRGYQEGYKTGKWLYVVLLPVVLVEIGLAITGFFLIVFFIFSWDSSANFG